MAKVRVVSLPFMQTTTTAAPEGGSHYLLSHIGRPCGLTYCLTISLSMMVAWRLGL
jgi:hypothetical protein